MKITVEVLATVSDPAPMMSCASCHSLSKDFSSSGKLLSRTRMEDRSRKFSFVSAAFLRSLVHDCFDIATKILFMSDEYE